MERKKLQREGNDMIKIGSCSQVKSFGVIRHKGTGPKIFAAF
jgi:hypothetical protein